MDKDVWVKQIWIIYKKENPTWGSHAAPKGGFFSPVLRLWCEIDGDVLRELKIENRCLVWKSPISLWQPDNGTDEISEIWLQVLFFFISLSVFYHNA